MRSPGSVLRDYCLATIKRIVETDLHCGAAKHLPVIQLHMTGFRVGISSMQQEEKLAIANPDAITMFECSGFDRYVVDESTVETFEVGYLEALAIFLNERVSP